LGSVYRPVYLYFLRCACGGNGGVAKAGFRRCNDWRDTARRVTPKGNAGGYQRRDNMLKKASAHHLLLGKLLEGIKETADEGGIKWDFKYKGKTWKLLLKLYVHTLLGDNEGQDKACGRKAGKTKIPTLCRQCECPFDKSGSTEGTTFAQICQQEITECHNIINDPDNHSQDEREKCADRLDELAHYCMLYGNAWDEAPFGSNKMGGINQATPADCVHTDREGMLKRLLDAILALQVLEKDADNQPSKRKRKPQSKKRKQNSCATRESSCRDSGMAPGSSRPGGSTAGEGNFDQGGPSRPNKGTSQSNGYYLLLFVESWQLWAIFNFYCWLG